MRRLWLTAYRLEGHGARYRAPTSLDPGAEISAPSFPAATANAAVAANENTIVWDLPLRLFHWALAALMVFSYATAKVGGLWLEWHLRSGLAILALLMFRLLWGIVGSTNARFVNFVRGPRAVIGYLRGMRHGAPRYPGHNPAGGWMVLLLLAIGLTLGVSGLFSDDSISTSGPLAAKVSAATVSAMTRVHHFAVDVLLAGAALHVLAITFYFGVKGQNLVVPMLTGRGSIPPNSDGRRAGRWDNARALFLFMLCITFVYWLAYLFPR